MARYAEVLFFHKLRFIALFLVPFVAAGIVGYEFLSFRASAVLQVQDPSSFGATFVPVGWSPTSTPAENLSDMVSSVIKTSSFSAALTDSLSAKSDASAAQIPGIVSSLSANFRLAVTGPHLLTLSYTCRSRVLCVSVLDDAIKILQAQLVSGEKDQATSISSFWTGQLKDAQASLGAAQAAITKYEAAHPGSTVTAQSTDPGSVQLYSELQLWQSKVVEAQTGLAQAAYIGTTSARWIEAGLSVVDPPHLASSRYIGDGTSLIPAALALLAGLVLAFAVLVAAVRMDRTARDPRSLERLVGVPVVATIPRLVGSRAS
jgi:hypothetical protein